jgi:hypothetical protein
MIYLAFRTFCRCLNNESEVNNASSVRIGEQFKVTFARTNRLANSAVPYMQRLLKAHEKQNKRTE